MKLQDSSQSFCWLPKGLTSHPPNLEINLRSGAIEYLLIFHRCGDSPSLQYGFDCKKGGLVKKGHEGLRDYVAGLANLAWGGVSIESILQADYEKFERPFLQADWMVRKVWDGDRVAFFD